MTSAGVSAPVPRSVSDDALLGVCALLFTACTAGTIALCQSMAAMGGMLMPGGWTMSMVWMPMPGQTWAGAAASFIGMWDVMMVAMMLPSLVPALQRYRHAAAPSGRAGPGPVTVLVGVGYFFVWTLFGMAIFAMGVALATVAMHRPSLARSIPTAAGLIVVIAGALQFTPWKARHLACCRESPNRPLQADARTAWGQGLRLGVHCGYSSLGFTAVLLVIGVMDLRAMIVVTAAMTSERLAPSGERVARMIGVVLVGAGVILIRRALKAIVP